MGSRRCALVLGAGDPAGSRLTTSNGSSPSPAPVPRPPHSRGRGSGPPPPVLGGGRPRRISTDDEQRIVAVAGARPSTLGVPLTRWSLHKLAEYLRGRGIGVSPAHLARILARQGLSFQ